MSSTEKHFAFPMLIKFDKIMIKKFIWIMNALQVLEALASGKRLVGELYIDEVTRQLTFKAFDRSGKKRKKDKTIRHLEHGWLKESAKNLKYYESIPKKVGMASVISILERDTKIAKETLIDFELINRV